MNPRISLCRRLLCAGFAVGLVILCGCAAGPSGHTGSSRSGLGRLFRPKGAPWTILCLELQGPRRMQRIDQISETLKRTPGVRARDVFVMDHDDGFVRLYYGTYYRRTDRKTGKRSMPKRLVEEMKLIKQLGTGPGEYYFIGAMLVRVPTPDVGKAEWALSNADGTYTVQVAAFEPTDDFLDHKQAAAAYCELLREEGYEAYYHHASACSVVTVGLFGPEAVKTTEVSEGGAKTVRKHYSSEVQELLRDELLKFHLTNGAIHRVRMGNGKSVPVRSRLVEMPGTNDTAPW